MSRRTISARRLCSDGINHLFAHDLRDDLALSRANVKVNVNDLLPGSQCKLPADERDDERCTQKRCAHVTVPVAITPAFVVTIFQSCRDDLVKEALQIGHSARLEFDCR
jgi:hypothetical protein